MRALWLSIPLTLVACPLFGGGGGGGPCADDANNCGNGGVLEVDDACELDDALQLQLGEGEGEFQVLAPGAVPELITGPQGGSHMVLGLGIDNPSPDHLSFEVQVTLTADFDGETEPVGQRTVVYEGAKVEFEGGRAELLDLVVIPDTWPDEGRRTISVSATDACGRIGSFDHVIE